MKTKYTIVEFVLTNFSCFWKKTKVFTEFLTLHWQEGQRVDLKTGVIWKQSTPNFPKNQHILNEHPDTHMYVGYCSDTLEIKSNKVKKNSYLLLNFNWFSIFWHTNLPYVNNLWTNFLWFLAPIYINGFERLVKQTVCDKKSPSLLGKVTLKKVNSCFLICKKYIPALWSLSIVPSKKIFFFQSNICFVCFLMLLICFISCVVSKLSLSIQILPNLI